MSLKVGDRVRVNDPYSGHFECVGIVKREPVNTYRRSHLVLVEFEGTEELRQYTEDSLDLIGVPFISPELSDEDLNGLVKIIVPRIEEEEFATVEPKGGDFDLFDSIRLNPSFKKENLKSTPVAAIDPATGEEWFESIGLGGTSATKPEAPAEFNEREVELLGRMVDAVDKIGQGLSAFAAALKEALK